MQILTKQFPFCNSFYKKTRRYTIEMMKKMHGNWPCIFLFITNTLLRLRCKSFFYFSS